VTELEILVYLDDRRAELELERRLAPQQPIEWAADGAIHELDRLEAVMRWRARRALAGDMAAARELERAALGRRNDEPRRELDAVLRKHEGRR
jgi:hypothetical protein